MRADRGQQRHHAKGVAGGDEWMVAGHYVFGLTKDGSSWKIRSMKLELLYQSGNLQLLAVAAAGDSVRRYSAALSPVEETE